MPIIGVSDLWKMFEWLPVATGFLRAANGQTPPAQENGNEKSGIAGTWQGTEHTPDGHDLRMELKIAKDENAECDSVQPRPNGAFPCQRLGTFSRRKAAVRE
jgi:hypothetical protein